MPGSRQHAKQTRLRKPGWAYPRTCFTLTFLNEYRACRAELRAVLFRLYTHTDTHRHTHHICKNILHSYMTTPCIRETYAHPLHVCIQYLAPFVAYRGFTMPNEAITIRPVNHLYELLKYTLRITK